jgi:peptidoglycan hydrolase CwlO-like protein
MNQPTREEFEQLKEEVRQLREQITEPIKITRVEVASADVVAHLDKMDQKLDRIDQKQDEHANGLIIHSRSINVLQEEMKGARADILSIKATLSDHGQLLREILNRLPEKQS